MSLSEKEEQELLWLLELEELESSWRAWLAKFFSSYTKYGFGPHHEEFWSWIWSIQKSIPPRPQSSFVAVWPRGGAKSTSAEMGCVSVGARQARKYVLYLSETQDQADDHVSNIGSMLEKKEIEQYYPDLAGRMVGKYGNSKGWRRNRLRTAAGFTIDAIGIDSAARGAKLDEDRPDMIVIDDVDGELDTLKTTQKKIDVITKKLIPAGSDDLVVLAIQNLVHPNSIFSQLTDGRADFLSDRIVSGPFPALRNMAYEQREGKFIITFGEPIWEGQSLEQCQDKVNKMGISAFLSECQQEVEAPPGGLFSHLIYQHCEWKDIPELVRIALWVDPAVTETDESDSYAIHADGLGIDGKVYRLFSWENRTNPKDALKRAILKAIELKCDRIGVETNQGGDTWQVVFDTVLKEIKEEAERQFKERAVALGVDAELVDEKGNLTAEAAEAWELEKKKYSISFDSAKATTMQGSKAHRAAMMLVDYENGKMVHVLGTHAILEKALNRFPKTKPFDLVDASYWAWHDLREMPYMGLMDFYGRK
jgi:hypothetical protein